MNITVQLEVCVDLAISSVLIRHSVFQQDGSVMGWRNVLMAVMRQTVRITPVPVMILVVPMEWPVLTEHGFVTEMMTVEICLMKLTVQLVNLVKEISLHAKMVFAFPGAGFVMVQMTAVTGLMKLIAQQSNVML